MPKLRENNLASISEPLLAGSTVRMQWGDTTTDRTVTYDTANTPIYTRYGTYINFNINPTANPSDPMELSEDELTIITGRAVSENNELAVALLRYIRWLEETWKELIAL